MAEPAYRYTTRFLASATVYSPSAKEQKEACASLDRLKGLLPPDINPEDQPTLLYLAGNLAVAAVANLNDDALTLEDALSSYRGFEWQLVDIEHNRSQLRGFIVKAGLSELGTDRLITEDEARAAGLPVNIAIVIALWRIVDQDLCDLLSAMNAPASPDKDKLSLSFEVGFNDYDIVMLPKGASNLSMASRIIKPDEADFKRFDRVLRVNGGKGIQGDNRVARILTGGIIPLGAGIVTVPAAAVKGLVTITESPHAPRAEEVDAGLYSYSSTQCTLSAEDAAPFLAYAAAIPDEHIATDPDDPTIGRETESHGTICYGLTTADPTAVQACFAGFGPITVTMGKVAAFTGGDRAHDVLYVEMHSPDMHRAHALVKTATEVQSKWPSYTSHLTLAYCKPGMARGYVGDTRFEGKTLTFDSITFSPHTGDRVEIALAAKPSPYTDQIGQVPVQPSATPDTSMAQSDDDEVYMSTESMATPSRQIKLSQGWQERLASLQTAEAGKEGNAPLVNGVNITLSDGRKLTNVKVFDGATLELDKELSMSGVVITDMTPGAPPQSDDQANEHPSKADVYPTCRPEKVAEQEAELAKQKAGQQAAYTDAKVAKADPEDGSEAMSEDDVMTAAKKDNKPYGDVQYADPGYQKDGKKRYPIDTEEHIRAAWSYINKAKNAAQYTSEQVSHIKSKIVSAWKKHIDPKGPESAKAAVDMSLADLGLILARLAAVDAAFASSINALTTGVSHTTISTVTHSPMNLSELKQSIASVKTVEDLPTALANVALFADTISKASEALVKERDDAKAAAKTTQATLEEVRTQLATLAAAQAAVAAETAYQERMAAVEGTFDLDEEVRAEIVDEIKACVDAPAFAKWLASAKKKMKGFMKKKPGEKPGDKTNDKEPDGDDDDTKAAKAAAEALASAKANVVDSDVNNNLDVNSETLAQQYQKTFAGGISIGGVKVKDITAAKTKK